MLNRMQVAFKRINFVAYSIILVTNNLGLVSKSFKAKLLNLSAGNTFTNVLLVVGTIV